MVNQSEDLLLKLLSSSVQLCQQLLEENNSFFPILFYDKNKEIISSTIFDENFDSNTFIDELILQKQIKSFVLSHNNYNKSAIVINSMIDNQLFNEMYIGYKLIDDQYIFSKELLDEIELNSWISTDF